MKKVLVALITTLLSVPVYAAGPGGDPGATGYFYESLYASERSVDSVTYVSITRQEYSGGYGYGYVAGRVYDADFFCELDYDEDLLAVEKDAARAVIRVDDEAIQNCWSNWPPAVMTFDCKASGYMGSKGVSNYETVYFDGYEYKTHSRYVENALDCVVFIGDAVVLDASSGVVWDGSARVDKTIEPNKEQEEHDD
ncbi:MAG: hypothetical protein WBO73_07380 [Gammaproteobacteria bacterium]|jgi:hypothetical protein